MEKLSILLLAFLFYCGGAMAQTITVSGTVTSADQKQPLEGVSVTVKGTNQGTTTDDKGQFSISVPGTARLVFSYLGYASSELDVAGRQTINVGLTQQGGNMNEVIVVGYGTQRKGDVTGAITSIPPKAIKEVPVTNVAQVLQGRAAGVYVVNNSNKPGAAPTVRIRGRRSFNAGNDPLYVIDGVPVSGGLNDINPGDVQSMEVLKDASATAIYGSRGANGVIIITTTRGRSGKPTVSYDTYLGISKIQRYADLMNGEQFAEYKRESRRAIGAYDDNDPEADQDLFEPVELESLAEGTYTDYQRLMIREGFNQNHDISVNGGSETTRYNMAAGYFKDKGIIPGQDYERFSTRINLDQEIGKRFRAGMSTLASYSIRNGEDVNPYGASADFGALSENPLGKAYDENGELIFLPTSDGLRSNPLSELVAGAVINRTKRLRLLSNLYAEAEIADGLRFRMSFAPDVSTNKKGDFRGRFTNTRRGGDPSAANSEQFSFSYTWENVLTYKKNLSEKHAIDLTGLYGVQTLEMETSNISVSGLPVESVEYFNFGSASIISGVGSGYQKWSILSYMARINYSFDNRFLLTFTGRADGSSKFAPGNKWGYFPSVAAAWNMMNESFMTSNRTFSDFKLRISYGETGNEGILPYQTNSLLGRTSYDFDGSPAFGYRPITIPNKDLKWESTASFNTGLDFGMFNNRISGSIEYYISTTRDILLPKLLPISGGYASVLTNIGSKRNRGVEFSVSTVNIASESEDGFEWTTDLNLFTNKEEILELSLGKVSDVGNRLFIGQPATVYYDFVKTGIWQIGEDDKAAENGSFVGGIKVQDVNNNGTIDPDDRQILGSDVPDLMGGMTNRLSYKGFDLSAVLFARFGSTISSPFHGAFRFLSGRVNQYNIDYWTPTNPTNEYPRPNSNQETPRYGSTLAYIDGTFVKIRNISLGYNFKPNVIKRLRAQSLRVYVNVQNPFVFSPFTDKYNGIDPEFPTTSTPPVKLFLAGLNIKF